MDNNWGNFDRNPQTYQSMRFSNFGCMQWLGKEDSCNWVERADNRAGMVNSFIVFLHTICGVTNVFA